MEEPIEGMVYRGTPKGYPWALYVVLEDAARGIVIKQVVDVEPHPETDQLIAYAEDLPQLPFSHLHLSLFDGEGSPLLSPPLCGDYKTRVEFAPWSESAWYVTSSGFTLDTGPGGVPVQGVSDCGAVIVKRPA